MNRSETIAELATALALAQGKFPTVKKDANNPFFKSKYADLAALIEAVQEPLSNNGLAIVQLLSTDVDAKFVRVETVLTHKSGEYISDVFSLPVLDWKPQGLGSATTYARRYALQSFLNLGAADDDGNAAQGPQDFTPRAKQDIPKPRTAPSPTPAPSVAPEPPNAQPEAFQDEDYPEFTDDMTPKAKVAINTNAPVIESKVFQVNADVKSWSAGSSPKSKGDPNQMIPPNMRQKFWAECKGIADEATCRKAFKEITGQNSVSGVAVHQTGQILERLREMVREAKGIPSPFDSEVTP